MSLRFITWIAVRSEHQNTFYLAIENGERKTEYQRIIIRLSFRGQFFCAFFSGQKGGFMNKFGGRDPPGKYHAAEKRRKIKQNCGKEKETLMDSAKRRDLLFCMA